MVHCSRDCRPAGRQPPIYLSSLVFELEMADPCARSTGFLSNDMLPSSGFSSPLGAASSPPSVSAHALPASTAASISSAASATSVFVSNVAVGAQPVPVPVTRCACVPPDAAVLALASAPFRDWLAGVDPRLCIDAVLLQSVDLFGSRVGFIKFVASATLGGKRVPGIVFMRGGAVAVLVVLHSGGARWAVCTRQPRVPVGAAALLEIPAGMLDGSGAFSGIAAKELAEETGLIVEGSQLIDMSALVYEGAVPGRCNATATAAAAEVALGPPLVAAGVSDHLAGAASEGSVTTDGLGIRALAPLHGDGAAKSRAGLSAASAGDGTSSAASSATAPQPRRAPGVYTSPGGSDEFMRLLYYRADVSAAQLAEMQGRLAGSAAEDEHITLDIVPLEELWWRAPDAKTLAALLLYEKLRSDGSIA